MIRNATFSPQTPPQTHHRYGRPPPELAEAVLRLAPGARMVAYSEFAQTIAGGDQDGGEKRLQKLKREKRRDDLAAKHADLAAAVVEAVAEQAPANRIGEARHFPTQPRVVPVVPPATRDVQRAGLDRGEQHEEVARVVLAVTIQREDELAPRGTQALE